MEKALVVATVVVLVAGLLCSCAQAFGAQCVQDPATGKISCTGSYEPKPLPVPPPPVVHGPERG